MRHTPGRPQTGRATRCETTIPADAGLAEARVDLDGLQDKFVSVRIVPEGSGKIEYQVSARTA
jgi:hypothetical protein